MARAAGPTKTELQQQVEEYEEQLDQVAKLVDDLLNPINSREQLVEGLQELDQLLTADEEDEDEEDAGDEDEDEEETFL